MFKKKALCILKSSLWGELRVGLITGRHQTENAALLSLGFHSYKTFRRPQTETECTRRDREAIMNLERRGRLDQTHTDTDKHRHTWN